MRENVYTYWWDVHRNFGDQLTPLLVKHFMDLDPLWIFADAAEVLVAGSILEHISDEYTGIITGVGQLQRSTYRDLSNATVLGLRGPLTLERSTVASRDIVLADPGLLASELVPAQPWRFGIGVVPHWTDDALYERECERAYWGKYDKPMLIDPQEEDCREVVRKIGSCKRIVSSSLHGIIVADSFGIPRRAERYPLMFQDPYEGGEFKWHDYSASINLPIEFGELQRANIEQIYRLQSELFDMFIEAGRLLREV